MKCRLFLIAFSLVLLLQGLIWPQQRNGGLSGIVSDGHRSPLPRARVVLTTISRAPATVRKFEAYTDDQGKFMLKNLPSASYEVSISHSSSEAVTEKMVRIVPGRTTEGDFEVGRGCALLSDRTGSVTNVDRREAVRLALLEVTDSKWGLLTQEQRRELIISTTNIRTEWLYSINSLSIKLLTQNQIQHKANTEGDFLYLSFPEIRVRGRCVAVTVTNSFAIGRNSGMAPMSGGGLTFEYRKQAGKWSQKFVRGWVS